jgi:peptide/nickel transport system substrate-binding protein
MTTHRRGFATLALISVTAGALLLAGCSSTSNGSSGASGAGTPVTGGSLTYGVETEPATLNPQLNGQDKARVTLRNAYDNLFAVTASGKAEEWLATGYKISNDNKTYTISLRHGVTFWDGEKFNAAAVKTNIDELLNGKYDPFGAAGPFSHIASISTVGDDTVVFNLKSAYAPFLITLANLPIISPDSYKKADIQAGGPDIAGTGPFLLSSYTKGQDVVFTKNPKYDWAPATATHNGPAYLNKVTIRFLPEASVRTNALLSGQVDVIEGIPGTSASEFKGNSKYTYSTALNTGTPYSLYFNTTYGPTKDIKVREAFRDAVNLDEVLNSVYAGQRTRAWSAVSPEDPNFYDKSLAGTYGNNVTEANTLLDAAGWTGPRTAQGYRTNAAGEVLTIQEYQDKTYVRDNRDVLLQAIQAQLKQNVGIDFNVQEVDDGTASAHQTSDTYGTYDNSNTDPDGVDIEYHWLPAASGGFINLSQVSDPQLTQWLTAAQQTTDVPARAKNYDALQQYVIKDKAYSFPLYEPADQIASASYVHGISFRSYFQIPESEYDVWVSKH